MRCLIQSLHNSSLKGRLRKMLYQSPLHSERSRHGSPWALGRGDDSGRRMDCGCCSQSTKAWKCLSLPVQNQVSSSPHLLHVPSSSRGALWRTDRAFLTSLVLFIGASFWNDSHSYSKRVFVKVLGKESFVRIKIAVSLS